MNCNIDIFFKKELLEGIIKKKKNRFIAIVEINNELIECHLPTTGRIGNINLEERPCLLSESNNVKRKTKYTVEAISLDLKNKKEKKWIGINQIAINGYIQYFLKNDYFSKAMGLTGDVKREVILNNSKIDFKIGSIYLEVKTPLQQLQLDIPDHVKLVKPTSFKSTDRFSRHISDLANNLKKDEKAILLNCFLYDCPSFTIINKSENYLKVKNVVGNAKKNGVELWQVNLEINSKGIKLISFFCLENID